MCEMRDKSKICAHIRYVALSRFVLRPSSPYVIWISVCARCPVCVGRCSDGSRGPCGARVPARYHSQWSLTNISQYGLLAQWPNCLYLYHFLLVPTKKAREDAEPW